MQIGEKPHQSITIASKTSQNTHKSITIASKILSNTPLVHYTRQQYWPITIASNITKHPQVHLNSFSKHYKMPTSPCQQSTAIAFENTTSPLQQLQKNYKLRNSASSFHWLSSSIFSCSFVVRPSRIVTSPLISTR